MIFQIDQTFYDSIAAPDRAQLYSDIIMHGHYVDCHHTLREQFYGDIDAHGSTLQKNMKEKDPSLNLSTMFKQYLTTVNVNTLKWEQLRAMVERPALLMVENEANERQVYYEIIRKYAKKDKSFKSLFVKLADAMDSMDLDVDQAGGYSQLTALFESHDKVKYHGIAQMKICMLADRDTKNDTYFDINKNSFFKFVCGKDSNAIKEDDIYSLNQAPYIWHMWYFRAIENYFPAKQYVAMELDPSQADNEVADWHYKDLSSIPGYEKKNLSKLTKGMSYDDYEDGLRHFPSQGDKSEMQLFLLKLVRII